jgi:hypothetical protein
MEAKFSARLCALSFPLGNIIAYKRSIIEYQALVCNIAEVPMRLVEVAETYK